MQNTEAMYEDKWNKLCTWDRIKADFPPHFHSYVELLVVKDGVCDVTVDFTEYRMEAGDAVLIFPNVIHSYCAVQSPVKNLTYILPTDFFPLFSDTFAAYRPSNPILKGIYKNAELRAMLESAVTENKSGTPFGTPAAAAYLALLLSRLLPDMELLPASKDISSEGRILAYCSTHFRENISLETLEKELHLSRFHISHLFNDRLHISFSALMRRLRIDEACKLLKNGATVTSAAYASGFGSLRNFNRAFAAEKGITPSEYAKKHAKQSN